MTREEAIKTLMSATVWTDDEREALETLIPELRESEDERIRKEIIVFLSDCANKKHIVVPAKFFTYLEKQEEQKPWKVGANAYFTPEQKPKRKRKKPKESWLSKAKYELEHADELLIKRQKELSEIRALKNKEQKPAEWSEEDVDMLNSCISSIEEAKENRYAYKETDGDTSYDHEIDWLKSLRPQPKQEWSEEDEIRLKEALEVLDESIKYLPMGYGFLKDIMCVKDWLKSLRPQPKQEWDAHDKAIVGCIAVCLDGQFVTEAARKQCLEWFNKHRIDFLNSTSWRPSEEQMEALQNAVALTACDKELARLYNQLKAL